MSAERDQLLAGIAALEAQRAILGDAVVDASVAGLRARLDALAGDAPAQSLRQVTILFLDVVGSTTLAQHLDPEEIHAVMDGTLARCTAVVEAHGGKVLQYAGDNLLAVFGADEAREDDAERAVRCGLALLGEGRRAGEDVRLRHDHEGFDLRLGVHTGGVLLGGGVDAEGSIRGIAVNVAARMEQTAPAGAMRISDDTWRLVRGAFDAEAQEPIAVKGVDMPIRSHLVLRARPRAFRVASRGIEGVATRMIGREAELAALQQAFGRLFDERRFALVAVVGEAGVGKSRLLDEFEAWADLRPEPFTVFRGRATPQTPTQPYGLLRDIVASRLQIGDADSLETARRKIERGIASLFDGGNDAEGAEAAEPHAHLLGHLIGIDFSDSRHIAGIKDDARQIRNRAFHAAAQMLRRVAGAERGGVPVVLLLEDLHWADDGTLDFLDHLAQVDADVAVLALALTRPSLFERRSRFAAGLRIDLGPLDHAGSRRLAGELLHKLAEIPDVLRELVAGRSEGNPFYMEELVKMLVDQGAIAAAGETWTLRPDRLLETQVPATLTGVLQARLDGLPAPERLALQEASVIGLVFWDRALAALDERAPEALPALVRRELARPRAEALLDEGREFAFSHQILHQVTYGTLLKRTRRALHARVAAWLAGLTGARASDFLGATALHYAQAGDTAQAVRFFARAAEHAKTRFAHDVVLDHAARALALLAREPDGPEPREVLALRWRLLIVHEYALSQQGRRAEQRSALDALAQVADALDDDALRSLAAQRRSMLGLRTADYRAQEAFARQAVTLAERAGDAASKLESQRLLADALGALGDVAGGEALAREGLAEARARGLRRAEGVFLNTLSLIALQRDDQVSGLALDLQDLPIWRELGDPHGESVALGNIGGDWLWFGELAQARPALEEALKIARAIGARNMECGPLGNLAQLALWEGDATRSLALARAGLDVAMAIQAKDFEAQTLVRVGEAELALEHHAAAAEAFARAEALGREIGIGVEHDGIAGQARVALARGDLQGAMGFVEALLATRAGRPPGDGLEGADLKALWLTCHRALARAGDARAAELLAAAHDALQARAATISDPALRESYLANVPDHRAIRAAWQAALSSP